jgi:hypothetical protein
MFNVFPFWDLMLGVSLALGAWILVLSAGWTPPSWQMDFTPISGLLRNAARRRPMVTFFRHAPLIARRPLKTYYPVHSVHLARRKFTFNGFRVLRLTILSQL